VPDDPRLRAALAIALAFLVILFLVSGIVLCRDYLTGRPLDLRPVAQDIDTTIGKILADKGTVTGESEELEDETGVWLLFSTHAELNDGVDAAAITRRIKEAMRPNGFDVAVSNGDLVTEITVSAFGKQIEQVQMISRPTTPSSRPAEEDARRSRVAIIIDDVGYGGEATEMLLEVNAPLTFSVLPKLPQSSALARRAHEAGFEVMLHLPLVSHATQRVCPGAVWVNTTREEIGRTLEEDLETVPFAVGLNNHQGSVYTSNELEMHRLLSEIKELGVFFIDSRTTFNTVGLKVAREMGIRSAERDVFLDNEHSADYIDGQMEELVGVAHRDGKAIGIGHCHHVETAQAVRRLVRRLEDMNLKMVPVSELVE